jgi:hypothetical protein
MPGSLMRSKSMRLLKGYLKDNSQPERSPDPSMPRSDAPQTNNDRYRSAAPISGVDEKLGTLDMAVRPSTSGGQGDRRLPFHMKTNHSPSVDSQSDLSFLSPTISTTVLYATEFADSREGVIGIALGSPTVGSHWNLKPKAATFDTNVLGTDDQMSASEHSLKSPAPTTNRPLRTKLDRWKSLFRKAGSTPPEKSPFYQLAQTLPTTRPARADSHQNDELEPQVSSRNDRTHDRSQSPSTYNLHIRASRKAIDGQLVAPKSSPEQMQSRPRACTAGDSPSNQRASMQRSATTPIAHTNSLTYSSAFLPQVVLSKSERDVTDSAPGNRPLLDISIPDTKMERYSIMFGNLLQPTPDRTSLLVRRQGNAEKVKPLNNLSVKVCASLTDITITY